MVIALADTGSPVGSVLERLEGVRRASRGWSARCPHHEDRHASLSIAEGRGGRVLLHCFAGCLTDDVVGELGLTLADLFSERRSPALRIVRPPRRHPVPRHIAQVLLERDAFALEWEAAKLLARGPEQLARQDILASWDWLADRVDIPFVLSLSGTLRGMARLRYGSRRDPDGSLGRAVTRLLEVAL